MYSPFDCVMDFCIYNKLWYTFNRICRCSFLVAIIYTNNIRFIYKVIINIQFSFLATSVQRYLPGYSSTYILLSHQEIVFSRVNGKFWIHTASGHPAVMGTRRKEYWYNVSGFSGRKCAVSSSLKKINK